MVQWEYYVTQRNMSERWSAKRQREELIEFNAALNEAGGVGWEMVSYEAIPLTGAFTGNIKGYAYLLFFKRPRLQ